MAGFQCPYCSMIMPVSDDTMRTRMTGFNYQEGTYFNGFGYLSEESCIEAIFCKCPNCGQYIINVKGVGQKVSDVDICVRPNSLAKRFPTYIPEAIRNDYEEAYAIVNLSPKASATLSRRCLQGMIRDFWEIKESNLSKAIGKLEGRISATQWQVIDGVRRIGNIGAHMEKDINLIVDIESGEAQKLLKLIEHLLEQWYINRHEQEQLYADIIGIDAAKQVERKKTE